MFDFLKSDKYAKKKTPGKPDKRKKSALDMPKGVIKVDRHVFQVSAFDDRGFVVDPYDRDILIKGQKFQFEIDVEDPPRKFKGRAHAVVMTIKDNKLAAAFTMKLFE